MDGQKIETKNKLLTGFTIIELVILMTVTAILITIAIFLFQQLRDQLSLSRAVYQFSQEVKKSQTLAITQIRYYDASGAEQVVDGYGTFIDFNTLGNKKYLIYADKNPGNQQYDSSDYVIETIDFSVTEPGIFLKEITNVMGQSVSINFNSSDLVTIITPLNLDQDTTGVVFAITTNTANTKNVLINTAGLVETQ